MPSNHVSDVSRLGTYGLAALRGLLVPQRLFWKKTKHENETKKEIRPRENPGFSLRSWEVVRPYNVAANVARRRRTSPSRWRLFSQKLGCNFPLHKVNGAHLYRTVIVREAFTRALAVTLAMLRSDSHAIMSPPASLSAPPTHAAAKNDNNDRNIEL